MPPPNIVAFNRIAGRVLGELYEAFPARRRLDAFVLADRADAEPGPDGAVPAEVAFVVHVLRWLKDAGFVWGEPVEHGLLGATLSVKGFEALKSIPSAVNPTRSIGDQLLSALKSGVQDAVSETCGLLFVETFRTFFRQL